MQTRGEKSWGEKREFTQVKHIFPKFMLLTRVDLSAQKNTCSRAPFACLEVSVM